MRTTDDREQLYKQRVAAASNRFLLKEKKIQFYFVKSGRTAKVANAKYC